MPGKDRKKYGATDEILSLYDKGLFKKGKDFDNNALHQLIDFYKSALPKYTDWRVFNFQFKPTEQYEDISQFYAEVEQQGYKLSRKKINSQLLHRFVEEGKCYLFEISCKDFKHQHLTSKDNLQTIYWKTLFQPHSNVKLNGEAEIFFRKASLQQKQPIITNENNYTIKNEKAIKS
jgi:CRISPR-associated protein Cpf1